MKALLLGLALAFAPLACSEEEAPAGDGAGEDGGGEAAEHGPPGGDGGAAGEGGGDGGGGVGQPGGAGDPNPQPDPEPDPQPDPDPDPDPDPGGDLGPAVPQGYVKECRVTCAGPEDCVPEGLPEGGAHSPQHYVCNDGACQYLGCADDDQCKASYNDQYACKAPITGGTPLQCTVPCIVDGDCAKTQRPHVDADNWTCLDGACLYQGCKSDDECKQGRGFDWVCRPVTGGVPTCFQTCGTEEDPSDASMCKISSDSLFDADNHVCDGGLCIYGGCIDDADCRAYHETDNLLCR